MSSGRSIPCSFPPATRRIGALTRPFTNGFVAPLDIAALANKAPRVGDSCRSTRRSRLASFRLGRLVQVRRCRGWGANRQSGANLVCTPRRVNECHKRIRRSSRSAAPFGLGGVRGSATGRGNLKSLSRSGERDGDSLYQLGPRLAGGERGKRVWIDLRGEAAPRLTADRSQAVVPERAEVWEEAVAAMWERYQVALVQALGGSVTQTRNALTWIAVSHSLRTA